jgi:hypothetical protein
MLTRRSLVLSGLGLMMPLPTIGEVRRSMIIEGPAYSPREWLEMTLWWGSGEKIAPLKWTKDTLPLLVKVNKGLKRQKWGESGVDWWKGGCTVYTMWARSDLEFYGINLNHLRPTICKLDPKSPWADHMCLTVVTTDGDYILDINAPGVTLFSHLPYGWVYRLSNDGIHWELIK